MVNSVIVGTGSYIPKVVKTNSDFFDNTFYSDDGKKIDKDSREIIQKFGEITGIKERRYTTHEHDASTIGAQAALRAIDSSGIDPESINQIIVGHNFGVVNPHTYQTDLLPSVASRIKNELKIKNIRCIPYDLIFGCPGWIQGVIQADTFIKANVANNCLIIGTETLSRALDPFDRDSMIFSDGAGACILQKYESSDKGILSHCTVSHCQDESYYLCMGKSNFPNSDPRVRYIKMQGRKVYEYAIKHVPSALKECMDKAKVDIKDLKKVFIHQANEKLDIGIIKRFYRLYGFKDYPNDIMPMTIHKFGNSSVATVPTLLDLVWRKQLDKHEVHSGDIVLFASVGAGMNINAVCYKV